MKRALRVLEFLVVAAALVVLAARSVCSDAYSNYRARGGRNGFAAWFAREKLGAQLPWSEDQDAAWEREQERRAEMRKREKVARDIARLEAAERTILEKMARAEEEARQKKRAAGAAAAAGHKHAAHGAARKGGHGGAVKTGGRSSFVAAHGSTPYRVTGIQGIEFGSSENAPPADARPLLSVAYDADGNQVFKQLKWRENKPLTDPIYGFDKAWLDHSYGSEQLSTVTFNKSFPFTEEGLREAVSFYRQMSNEASSDLGFEVVDKDLTGDLKHSAICEFTNRDGDTTIRGGINAWSDKSLTVTLKISDKAYASELKSQSNAAYDAGLVDSLDARVEVWNKDYTDQKVRVNEYLNQ